MFLFLASLVSFWQNNISLKLKDIKCYSSIIDIKSNDTITKKPNLVVMKLNETPRINLFITVASASVPLVPNIKITKETTITKL